MEANGIFVHLFRNKEAWKQHEGLLETAKGKFQAEREHRLKLAQELGIKRLNELPLLLSNIDPNVIFSEINNDEHDAVSRRLQNHYSWPELPSYRGYIPTGILDEVMLVNSFGVFSGIYVITDGLEVPNLLVGTRNKNRYLIAYWGSQEVYEKIQAEFVRITEMKKATEAAKLAEAEAAKLEEEQAKAKKEENSETGKKEKMSDQTFEALVFIGSIILGTLLMVSLALKSTNKQSALNVPTTVEVKSSSDSPPLKVEKEEDRKFVYIENQYKIEKGDPIVITLDKNGAKSFCWIENPEASI